MTTNYCPNCGAQLEPGSSLCNSCGSSVSPPRQRATGLGDRCATCGGQVDLSRAFCAACGQVFAAPAGVYIAGYGRRLVAYILDIVLVFLTLFIGYLIWWLFTLQWGQTPGKQLLGIRAIRADGTASGWVWTFLREFVIKGLAVGVLNGIFSLIIAIPIFTFLDPMWAIWDKNRQALHDKVMNTIVVDDRQAVNALRMTQASF